jgi:hypothetical protein
MPNNTDKSGANYTARIRRIAALQGATPANPSIGVQALDAQLGKLECCACRFNWNGSPIQLAYQKAVGTDVFFTAVFANAYGTVVPEFPGIVASLCGRRVSIIETLYSNNAGTLSVSYKISTQTPSYIPASITQQIVLRVTCEGVSTIYDSIITFLVPVDYHTECS